MDSRQKLIHAAKELFSEKGYAGTSVREIVSAAGVNISLVSYHFGSKEGLYEACIQTYGKASHDYARRVLQPPTSQDDLCTKIQLFIHGFMEVQASDLQAHRIAMSEFCGGSGNFKNLLDEFFVGTFRLMVTFFKQGQKDGYISKDLDPFEIANLLYGTIAHQLRVDHLRQQMLNESVASGEVQKKVALQISGIFLDGILGERTPSN